MLIAPVTMEQRHAVRSALDRIYASHLKASNSKLSKWQMDGIKHRDETHRDRRVLSEELEGCAGLLRAAITGLAVWVLFAAGTYALCVHWGICP